MSCAAVLACAASVALAQSPGGRPERFLKDSSADRVVATVHAATHDYVRIEQAEPGAALSQHPAVVPVDTLRAALASVRNAAKDDELFNEDELKTLVLPLAQALARAEPGQDVAFAVTGRHGGFGPLVPRTVTTGRVFRTADGLQLITGLVWALFEGQYLSTGVRIAFEPGRRAAPVSREVRIAAPNGRSVRADWVGPPLTPPAALGRAGAIVDAAAAPAAAPGPGRGAARHRAGAATRPRCGPSRSRSSACARSSGCATTA
ncbi:MAG: hypothetical protein MZW92_66495 [Comamonadaceae bacterium]|nr:hypothetical protein [Comamonadaceae bacterium]